uniref:Uncharacterized protein n=1 Tax=Anas platyrhynchos platyrhynchos TaxID=8840 RepID=A0A493THP0_ANAPP
MSCLCSRQPEICLGHSAAEESHKVPYTFSFRLKFIFGPAAVPALDLVDHRSVTRVVSPSGRTAYQVWALFVSCFTI